MLVRCALLASLFVVGGCGSESAVADDTTDARTESSTDDTGAADETSADAGDDAAADADDDTAPSDTGSADARPTCENEEEFEPNNSIPSAKSFGEKDDCDKSGGAFKGVVAGASDVDFWTYNGKDTTLCRVDVYAKTTSAVRLCAFVSCASGTTEIKRCVKGTPSTATGGVNGCCTDGPGEVEVEHTCPLVGTSDSAAVYMRVDAPTASTCTSYDVSYHF